MKHIISIHRFLLLIIILFLFSFNIAHAASIMLEEEEPETKPPEISDATGTVSINIALETIPNDLPLRIELHNIEENSAMSISPGDYQVRVGEYTIRIFRTLPGTDIISSNYQIIEDRFIIRQGEKIIRNYPQPKRRVEVTSYGTVGILAIGGFIPGSYIVPNPVYEYVKKYGTDPENTVDETTSYDKSGYDTGLHYGGGISGKYLLAGIPMMIEGQISFPWRQNLVVTTKSDLIPALAL